MTYQALRDEITSGTKAVSLAAPYAAGQDSVVAAILNARTERGYAPIVELAGYCAQQGITGGVQTFLEIDLGLAIPGGSGPTATMTPQIKGTLHTAMTILQTDYRLEMCNIDDSNFQAACGLLQMLGIMTASQYTVVLSLAANRTSRSELVLKRFVTLADVESARKGNN